MNSMGTEITVTLFVGLTTALTQAIKLVVPDRFRKFMPITSIVIGIGLVVFFSEDSLRMAILSGLVVGLTASGLFSGVKSLAGK